MERIESLDEKRRKEEDINKRIREMSEYMEKRLKELRLEEERYRREVLNKRTGITQFE